MRKHPWGLICFILLFVAPCASLAGVPESINLRRTVTVQVVEKTKDAVVNISATKLVSQRVSGFFDPFWSQIDPGQVMQVPANSLGSGFVIHPDGYVVTNNHVIDRAREIHVELADGRKLPAEIISADRQADLAILRIHSDKPFPTLELGDSSDLMIAEPVIAVGNPLGYSHSVSTGIVSAIHRDLKNSDGKTSLADLIQTDAAINPGNSGGPLLNAYGQVIGINTAIRSDAQNIGFSIPIDHLRDLIPELMNPTQANKVNIAIKLKERRTLSPPDHIAVSILTDEKSPHEVTAIDGLHPANIVDAYAMLMRIHVGQTVTLAGPSNRAFEKVIARAVPLPDAIVQAHKILGITIEPLTPMLAAKDHLDVEDGMLVKSVDADGIGAQSGLKRGDVIVRLGRYRISTLDDFAALVTHLPEAGRVEVGVVRGDRLLHGVLSFED